MNYLKNIIVSAVLLCSLYACETNIDYEGDPIENIMVMNALVQADSIITCEITRSNTILEPNIIQGIPDALVKLYKDGEFMEDLVGDSEGNYRSSLKATQLSSYAVSAEHLSFTNINAVTKILNKADAKVLSIETSSYGKYYTGLECKLEINDPVGEDFYRIRVYVPTVEYDNTVGEYLVKEPYEYTFIYVKSKDPVLNYNTVVGEDDEYEDRLTNDYQVFDDYLFDGEKYSLQFFIDDSGVGSNLDEASLNKYLAAIKFDVQKITKDVHKYFSSVEAHKFYQDSPFSEPVKVHSNVVGGAGVLGGVNSNIIHYNP